MSLLLRKVWDSVLSRSASSSGRSLPDFPEGHPSLGAFDLIPIDVFMQILRFLGPRDAARTSLVCKSWRLLVSDNRLWIFFLQSGKEPWDCLVFAETHLRSGFPMMMYYGATSELSFMQIYGCRAMVPGSVIVDGGSGYCKYGWSKYACPSGRCATFLEFGNIESPMYARLRPFFRQSITDTESARASRKQYREAIYSVLFDMNVPAVCAIDQAILALYAAKQTSGIVVNIGFNVTSIVPILRGKVMHEIGVEIVGQGALKLTGFLRELMQQRNISFESLYTVRTIKEKLCYVAVDYDAELQKDTEASCEVAGEGWFTLSEERFQTAEILFQPQMGGVRAMGLHRAVALCMDHCFSSEVVSDDTWFKTVVLAGGTSCLPGLPERLEKELQKLLPTYMSKGIKVLPPPYGADSAWFGAKIVSNVSTFTKAWCMSKKQFKQKTQRNPSSFIGTW